MSKRRIYEVLKFTPFVAVIIPLSWLAGTLIGYLTIKAYIFLSSFLSQFWINLIGVVAIFIVGAGLYLVREKWRVTYGILEVGFAMAYGWYAINKVAHVGYVETISIIAAVYLVVRGIDNIKVGRASRD